jgi:hypothetical protein
MSKLKVQIKSKAQIPKSPKGTNWFLYFDIPLTFACLPAGRDFEL